jgi:hypothetical protein
MINITYLYTYLYLYKQFLTILFLLSKRSKFFVFFAFLINISVWKQPFLKLFLENCFGMNSVLMYMTSPGVVKQFDTVPNWSVQSEARAFWINLLPHVKTTFDVYKLLNLVVFQKKLITMAGKKATSIVWILML